MYSFADFTLSFDRVYFFSDTPGATPYEAFFSLIFYLTLKAKVIDLVGGVTRTTASSPPCLYFQMFLRI